MFFGGNDDVGKIQTCRHRDRTKESSGRGCRFRGEKSGDANLFGEDEEDVFVVS